MSAHPSNHSPLNASFRLVPRTGVIFVMKEAGDRGFHYGNPEWANLGQGAPETGPLPGAPERLRNFRVEDAEHEYAPVGGLPALRQAVADLYNARFRRGMSSQYTVDNVAISSGGRAGLTRIAASLSNIHLGHFLPDYTAYEELLEVFRAFVPIPILLKRSEGFALSGDRLRSEITGKGLGALLLSNPCNPTGHAIQGQVLADWVAACRDLGCVLMVDEFYSHYLYGEAAAEGPALSAARYVEDVNRDPVVLIDGVTKNWRYPGWRISWTVGPAEVIERITSAGSFLDGGPSHPIQKAALPLIREDVANREAMAIQETFGRKRALVLDRLSAMGIQVDAAPTGSFYAFGRLSELPEALRDGMSFFRRALEEKVIVVPGEFFDVNPGKRRGHIPSRLKEYVRISFGPEEQTVREGLCRLEGIIDSER